jgi:CubicO group peptidase (beta-lactamase class C family)
MKLQEQDKLIVDDPITTYLPQYGFSPVLTIRELLNQTSGLADYVNFADFPQWETNGVDEPTALTQVAASGLHLTSGAEYEYCNSNYFILGSIIESTTQQSYSTVLSQLLFQPLVLSNTFYELPPANVSALSYKINGAMPTLAPEYPHRSAPFAAGALSFNVLDLVKWNSLLTTGNVVSPVSFQEMIAPPQNLYSPDGKKHGFGLIIDTFIDRPDIWHNGEILDSETANAVFLDDGFAVVVLVNSAPYDALNLADEIITTVCANSQVSGNC